MATKKPTKTKKVTEIDDAKVKIEVEEIEGKSEDAASTGTVDDSDKEKVEDKSDDVASVSTADESEEEVVAEEEEEIIEDFEDESSGRFSWKKVFLFIIVAALTGIIIVGVYLVVVAGTYKVTIEKVDKNEVDKSIDIPEVTPTPTEAPINKESFEITILNGSGIEGEAATVQELLEDEGYVVVEIGNADNAAYLDTEVAALEDVDEEWLNELVEVLNERGPTSTEDASSSQTEEVIIIVGSELTDPDATPTPTLE